MKNRVETKRLQDQQAKLRRDYLAQVRDKVIDARETDWYRRGTALKPLLIGVPAYRRDPIRCELNHIV